MARELIAEYTEGDTEPPLVRTVPSSLGIVDLTGFTIRMKIRRGDGITRTKTITETLGPDGHIGDPTTPSFFFTFVAGDLLSGDLQSAEIEYTNGLGGVSTERGIFFDVGPQL